MSLLSLSNDIAALHSAAFGHGRRAKSSESGGWSTGTRLAPSNGMRTQISTTMTRGEIFAPRTVDAVDAPDDLSLSELSQELQRVEWLGEPSADSSTSGHAPGRGGVGNATDHWSFEVSLVVFGALMGVAAYFWTT